VRKAIPTAMMRRAGRAGAVVLLTGACGALAAAQAVARTPYPGVSTTVAPAHIENGATKTCLDSNGNGAVYMNTCMPNDNYQKWHITDGGYEIVDNQTGRCLDFNHHQGIFTNPCHSGNSDLYEQWGYGGNPPATALMNTATIMCLDDTSHLFMNYCNVTDPNQGWLGVRPARSPYS
jgi:hypothetical protein